MSINVFFLVVLGMLLAMFTYFKPMNAQTKDQGEMPKMILESFIMYEVDRKGVEYFFEGKEGKRFDERYEVTSAKFSNNSRSLFETIRSDNALYQDKKIALEGNVVYEREDGLRFRSQEGTYDRKTSLIRTQGAFVLTQNAHRVEGRKLEYNTQRGTVSADEVRGSYQLP